uniref:E3 ubiquitin-protein ligase rififylin-like isoform X2 n=1 Tax=Crassostrea virginica TaxID=6565 RepID=A0A8B8EP67_CRAVI|nr:E3 ubiquitin-protein ligase rififylin-like isoform X2 [Crassostrea virginica]
MGQGASLVRDDIQTTHVYTTAQRNSNLGNASGRPVSPEMVCESCSASFNIFNRKKLCKDCGRYFCANCVMQLQQNVKRSHRQCKKCNILTSGNFTRQDLQKWKVKDLRSVLDKRNISTESCREKHDLIDLLVITFGVVSQSHPGDSRSSSTTQSTTRIHGNRGSQDPTSSNNGDREPTSNPQQDTPRGQAGSNSVPPSTSTTNQQRSQSLQEPQAPHVEEPQRSHSLQQNQSEAAQAERLRQRQQEEMRIAERLLQEMRQQESRENQSQQEAVKRHTLEDIKSVEDIEGLTVRQMKEVLVKNFVDYKGCVEKSELQDRVTRLWQEHQVNKQKTQDIINASDSAPGNVASVEDELCKICMDAAINCVLLECGHMVTCTHCGRRLAECPICRQNVVRAVHIFRS